MTLEEQILLALKGTHAAAPLSEFALSNYLGVELNSIQPVLDRMITEIPASLNRCKITRYGLAQMFYWPTGYVYKVSPTGIKINDKTGNVGRVPGTTIKEPMQKEKTESYTVMDIINAVANAFQIDEMEAHKLLIETDFMNVVFKKVA